MGDEEGEVGDDDEEEGGDEGGDEGALHPPDQLQLELEVGEIGVVVAWIVLSDLMDLVDKMWNDGGKYHVNMVVVARQVDLVIDDFLPVFCPLQENLLRINTINIRC